jgi:GTP-binding protein LepA
LSIPGFEVSKPFVFAGIFPLDTSEYGKLQESIERLSSNDSALSYEYEKSNALGQ